MKQLLLLIALLTVQIPSCADQAFNHDIELKERAGYEHWLTRLNARLVIDTPSMRFWLSNFNYPYTNIVTHAEFADQEELQRGIDAVIRCARGTHQPVCWWVTPWARPASMADTLESCGFIKGLEFTVVVFDIQQCAASPRQIPGLIIKRLTPEQADDISTWADIVIPTFEMESIEQPYVMSVYDDVMLQSNAEHYAAYYQGMLVGTATIVLFDGFAAGYNLAITPQARNKGIATTFAHTLLQRLKDGGIKHLVGMATHEALSIYLKMGAKALFPLIEYVWSE